MEFSSEDLQDILDYGDMNGKAIRLGHSIEEHQGKYHDYEEFFSVQNDEDVTEYYSIYQSFYGHHWDGYEAGEEGDDLKAVKRSHLYVLVNTVGCAKIMSAFRSSMAEEMACNLLSMEKSS